MKHPSSNRGSGLASVIRKLRSAVDGEIKRRLDVLGITPPMGRALVALRAAEAEACSQRELADALGITQPTMAAAVAALVRRDLVQVEGDPHDGRRNLLHLTQAGLDAAFAMENAEAKVIEVMLDGVAARDLKAAMSAMLTMLANLDPTRAERTGDAPDAHWAAREAAE